jgi:hypothetical protein
MRSSNDCPYCRQSFKYLPLEPGIKPIKYIHSEYKLNYIHSEYKSNNIKNKNQDNQQILCTGHYLSGKNKGEQCLNYCITDSKYCRFHNKKIKLEIET